MTRLAPAGGAGVADFCPPTRPATCLLSCLLRDQTVPHSPTR